MSEEELMIQRVITYSVIKAQRPLGPYEQMMLKDAISVLRDKYPEGRRP